MTTNRTLALILAIAVLLTHPVGCEAGDRFPRSPDGRYEATWVSNDSGAHLQVKKTDSGEAVRRAVVMAVAPLVPDSPAH